LIVPPPETADSTVCEGTSIVKHFSSSAPKNPKKPALGTLTHFSVELPSKYMLELE